MDLSFSRYILAAAKLQTLTWNPLISHFSDDVIVFIGCNVDSYSLGKTEELSLQCVNAYAVHINNGKLYKKLVINILIITRNITILTKKHKLSLQRNLINFQLTKKRLKESISQHRDTDMTVSTTN
jgi:hypothetical protein